MKGLIRRLLKKKDPTCKYEDEAKFWSREIAQYIEWYTGRLKERYQTLAPSEEQKVHCHTIEQSALLTWFELHQKPKYIHDLHLPTDAFKRMRLLDVGAGPTPSAEVFIECELYCLDPLLPSYIRSGYPLHCYRDKTRFVYGYSENMPFEDDFFDAVISMNAIDHVDDIYLTATEMGRVLKPNGLLRLHVHYHKETPTEPLELNDKIMRKAFSWCDNFKKIRETDKKLGSTALPGDSYALWSNF